VAWTPGTLNEQTCQWEGQQVWTSASQKQDGTIDVFLLDGEDGTIDATVPLPDVDVEWYDYGGYGAAVDDQGDLWMTTLGTTLVHVSLADQSYETFAIPERSYGMTVDTFGHVWGCEQHLSRFDIQTEQWDTFLVPSNSNNIHRGGCMADGEGLLWKANGSYVTAIDVETMAVVDEVDLGVANIWGVSIDFNGYVWGIPRNGTQAFRVDPETHEIETVNGLTGAYTYSDMTGFALSAIVAQ
jgi:streptogramin lyase